MKPGALIELEVEGQSLIVKPISDPLKELDGILDTDLSVKELKRIAESSHKGSRRDRSASDIGRSTPELEESSILAVAVEPVHVVSGRGKMVLDGSLLPSDDDAELFSPEVEESPNAA